MSFNLIIPAAANKQEYIDNMLLPKTFNLNKHGVPLCIEAAMSVDTSLFDSIYITILKLHDDLFGVYNMLTHHIKRLGLNAKVIVIDEPTKSQAETVYKTICQANITTGGIFIKDADCSFTADIYNQNGIVVYPLEKLTLVDPQHKSYVAVDDMQYITNTIEKRVIDHYFNAGGYCFESVNDFVNYYFELENESNLYLSHIVYSMLLDGHIFRPFMAEKYTDFDNDLCKS